MKTNKKIDTTVVDERTAGGLGVKAAKQDPISLLKRSVLANLLWENNFYEDGVEVSNNISNLIKKVSPQECFDLAVEARTKQKLRHTPLFIAREMAKLSSHKKMVGELLPKIILRADEIAEFLALYWKDGKTPISKQVKIGLGDSFNNFNEYQFAKYNRDNAIKLRDVLFLTHAKPVQGKEELFKKIANNTLTTPDTWEVALSTGKNKKESWERLISEKKLGALAFLRNLRNMEEVGVNKDIIINGLASLNPTWLLPINYYAAAKASPRFEREIEQLMFRSIAGVEKLPGHSIFVVDVSGSMNGSISTKSRFNRIEVASVLAMMASELCERISIYATAGNDGMRKHKTALVPPRRGFALIESLNQSKRNLGGGGIFTRQCLEFIKKEENVTPDRIMIFSDSQDCDHANARKPQPFGINNYIIDVSSHSKGINYKGIWTAEISGWSENFLNFIAGFEGLNLNDGEQDA